MYTSSNLISAPESVQEVEEIFQPLEDKLITITPSTVGGESDESEPNINRDMFDELIQGYFIRAFENGVFAELVPYKSFRDFYCSTRFTFVNYIYSGEAAEWVDKYLDDGFAEVSGAGKFPKRFAKAWKEEIGWKLPQDAITNIGNIYNRCKISNFTFNIKFTNNFNWDDGMFGKDGSCWWGGLGNSRDTLYHYGGWGMLFFDEQGKDKGRTWILPVKMNDKRGLFLFNSYGVLPRDAAAVMAKFMEELSSEPHSYGVRSIYNDEDSDYPYINHVGTSNNCGGSSGYLVYKSSEKDSFTKDEMFEVSLKRKWGTFTDQSGDDLGDGEFVCYHCGHRHEEYNMIYIDGINQYVCYYCFSVYYFQCEGCGNTYRRNERNIISDSVYCDGCFNSIIENGEAQECYDCGQIHTTERMVETVDTGNWFCRRHPNRYFICVECGEINEHSNNYMTGTYCDSCIQIAVERHEENSVLEHGDEYAQDYMEIFNGGEYAFHLEPNRYSTDSQVLQRVISIVHDLAAELGTEYVTSDAVVNEYRRRNYQ